MENLKLIPSNRNFILAKAYIPSWVLIDIDEIHSDKSDDYSIYSQFDTSFIEGVPNKVNLKKTGIRLHPEYYDCTIYWVRKCAIDVPFGYRDDAIYGVLQCTLGNDGKCIESFIEKAMAFPNAWKDEKVGDITFHYLMDYFVDDKSNLSKQKGLSIELRNIWYGYIKTRIQPFGNDININAVNDVKEDGLTKAIDAWGLTFGGFTKLGKKNNVQE